jgi:ubiquinone/menaquinone biosynthesis C-methylase UbiE
VLPLLLLLFPALAQKPVEQIQINAPYVTSSESIVDAMLKLAGVTAADTVYDLGCGDGRIVIAAAKKFGAHGVGVDINPARIAEARENARAAGVESLVRFETRDLFDTGIGEASVVMLYLLPDINLRLRPKLLRELKPGTRVVSHDFNMGDWKPEKEEVVEGSRVYLWRVCKGGAPGCP